MSFSCIFLWWWWFFFINRNNFVRLSTSPKNSEILMSEVAKALKLTLFTVRSLETLTPAFSQIFSVTSIFFSRFWQQALREAYYQNLMEILMEETKGTVVLKLNTCSMFHVTWTTLKFNKNQLGTVSAFVTISMPWSNQRAHQVISEKFLSEEFHCRTTDQK